MSFLGSVVNLGKYNPGQPLSSKFFSSLFNSTRVDERSSMSVSSYYRGVVYLSTQVAKLPIFLKDANNGIIDSNQSKKYLQLLTKRPNLEMSGFTFWCFILQSAINRGNGYAEIVRDRKGRIVELYPIRSEAVIPFRDTSGAFGKKHRLLYRIVGGSTVISGQDTVLEPKDILHIKNFYTKDGIEGQSIIEYAADTLGISLGASKFSNGLYANGGVPSGVVTFPGALSKEAAMRLKESWDSRYGDRKVGGTAILEEGAEYKPLTLQPDQLQFLETKKFSVPEIARFLGVPPTKLFAIESAKYNNIEHENISTAVDTIDPWLKNIQDEIDMKFFNASMSINTWFDISALFRADSKGRGNYYKDLFSLGAINSNEIRIAEGKAPHVNGDRYYIASNNLTPMDRVDETLDNQNKSSENKNEDDNAEIELKKATAKFLSNKR